MSYNKWLYANSNPLYYTDASGNIPVPLLLLLLLGTGITIFGTSGCSTGPEPSTCPPLPSNLEVDSLKKMAPEVAISEIQKYFGIQLPPLTTYVDANGQSHSASYKFVYDSSLTYDPFVGKSIIGFAPWFHAPGWGTVVVGKSVFEYSNYNAYDIAALMVHESYHVWVQHTFAELAKNSQSVFAKGNLPPNLAFYTEDWHVKYYNHLEYEAYKYEKSKIPSPLCVSSTMKADVEAGYRNHTPSDSEWIQAEGFFIPLQPFWVIRSRKNRKEGFL